MKERNSLEWIILCELFRARKRYGPQVTDEYVIQDTKTLTSEYALMEQNSKMLPRWYSMVNRAVPMAVSGRVVPGRELEALNLTAWYRSGGQF